MPVTDMNIAGSSARVRRNAARSSAFTAQSRTSSSSSPSWKRVSRARHTGPRVKATWSCRRCIFTGIGSVSSTISPFRHLRRNSQ